MEQQRLFGLDAYGTPVVNPKFDVSSGQAAKDADLENSAADSEDLSRAREIAIRLAMASPDRETNLNEVAQELAKLGIDLGAAACSVFDGKNWVFMGKRIRSSGRTTQSLEVEIWRLADLTGTGMN